MYSATLPWRWLIASLALTFTICTSANSAVSLPGGDTLGNGAFDDVGYGATGVAFVTPLLFVGELNATASPSFQASTTNLAYSYGFEGLGTSLLSVTYSITNEGGVPFTNLRFMVDVQPDGPGGVPFLDTAQEVWGPPATGEPDNFQIADLSTLVGGLASSIAANNGLNATDACGGNACDVDFALQWNLAALQPNEVWNITVGLSDDGTALSNRFLRATSASTANTVLTFSGTAQVVPEPGTYAVIGLGLAFLLGWRRLTAQA